MSLHYQWLWWFWPERPTFIIETETKKERTEKASLMNSLLLMNELMDGSLNQSWYEEILDGWWWHKKQKAKHIRWGL